MTPAISNHLLQSTVFAVAAGMVTLFLRNNHARTRYWIWLAASLKFLVPFSLFVEIGHWLSWPTVPAISQPQLVFVMDQITQPFVAPDLPAVAPVTNAAAPSIVPTLLLALWICGFAAVLIFWFVRWRRVAVMLRTGTPVGEGRELRALRRLDGDVELISSPAQIEPGVFGILRPVLSLPAGISNHLDDGQLDAILAHELCHIRRRDNLTAALHMLVEAVFWFHPLVWWMGARLVEERERACDEEVVRLGSDPEIYAESILKICRFYLGSPLPCAAGISGADLGKRIESIMANPLVVSLSLTRKLLLGAMGTFALLIPIASGIFAASAIRGPEFLAASMKSVPLGPAGCAGGPGTVSPEQFTCGSIALGGLLRDAFGVDEDRTTAPGWVYLENYAITAKIPAGATRAQFQIMLRNLLADRFQLVVHHATRESPGYDLVVAPGGHRMKDSALVPNASARRSTGHGDSIAVGADGFPKLGDVKGMSVMAAPGGRSLATYQSFTLAALTRQLAHQMGTWSSDGRYAPTDSPALVVDKTGLTGEYDFTLEYVDYGPGGNNIAEAIEKQLGLKLQKVDRVPVDLLVVDHVEKVAAEH